MNEKTIFHTEKTGKFTQIDRELIDQKRLSLSAKALLIYCLSKTDGYHHNELDILRHCSDGRHAMRASMTELTSAGYVIKMEKRDEFGKYMWSTWFVLEDPKLITEIDKELLDRHWLKIQAAMVNYLTPPTVNPQPVNPQPENPPTVNPQPVNPQPENPQTENPQTENPQPENRAGINNDHTKIKPSKTKSSKATEIFSWYTAFKPLLDQYGVDEPDDILDFDGFDFHTRAEFFLSELKTIKNPKGYLIKLLESVRRKTDYEKETEKIAAETKTANQLKTDKINAFEFTGKDEMQFYMTKYRNQATQFWVYYKHPETCPPGALFLLKKLAMNDGSYTPSFLTDAETLTHQD